MVLKEELKTLRERLEAKRPPETVATMHRAVDELRASGAPGQVLKPGGRSRHLGFEILSDAGNEVAARFGLRFALPDYLRALYATFPLDLAVYNGDASWTLPMPACFIIDQEGIIRYAESDPDYTTRPEPDDTLAALRALRRP